MIVTATKSRLVCLLVAASLFSIETYAVDEVPLYALLADNGRLSEKLVVTTGYFCLSGYSFSIHPNEESCNTANYGNAISFELPISESVRHEAIGSGKIVKIQGVYRPSVKGDKVSTSPYNGSFSDAQIINVLEDNFYDSNTELKPSTNDFLRVLKSYTKFLEKVSAEDMVGLLEYFGVEKDNPAYNAALARITWVIKGSENSFIKNNFTELALYKSSEKVSATEEQFSDYKLCLSSGEGARSHKGADVHKMLYGYKSVCIEFTERDSGFNSDLEVIGDGWVTW